MEHASALTPEQCFNKWKETILSIPDDQEERLTMPDEEAMQEGRRVEALVNKYRSRLEKSDICPVYLDTIGDRAKAFAWSVAVMESFVVLEGTHRERFILLKKEGHELRRVMLVSLEYIFRNDKHIASALSTIRDGRGDIEMTKDLLSLYNLYTKFKDKCDAAHIDTADAGRLQTLYEELSEIISSLRIDPGKVTQAKRVCLKAWTFLYAALREIYAAGRFVFVKKPKIQELFYIDYLQRISKIRHNGEQPPSGDEPPAEEPGHPGEVASPA